MEKPVIAACGLFCEACRRYKSGGCAGCAENERAAWCTVRSCCREHAWQSCAECPQQTVDHCPKFNSFMGKVFGFVFRSDRRGCIERIREVGYQRFAEQMRESGCYNRPTRNK